MTAVLEVDVPKFQDKNVRSIGFRKLLVVSVEQKCWLLVQSPYHYPYPSKAIGKHRQTQCKLGAYAHIDWFNTNPPCSGTPAWPSLFQLLTKIPRFPPIQRIDALFTHQLQCSLRLTLAPYDTQTPIVLESVLRCQTPCIESAPSNTLTRTILN
jgi:hypothetical protein